MNAVIYSRVSTGRQVQGASLDDQEARCQEWALTNQVLVKRTFREEGQSAKTMNRRAFQEMKSYLLANASDIDYLIIYEFSRLSRNTEDYFEFNTILKKCDIALKDPTSALETQRSDKLIRYFQAITAELDNDVKSDRVTHNMQKHAKDGYRMAKAPYGLRNVRDALGKSTVTPVEGLGELIALTLQEYAKGAITIKELIEFADDIGLKKANGQKLNHSYMGKMLRQPLYAGLERNKHTGGLLVPSVFEGIVPEKVFHRNQQLLSQRQANASEVHSTVSPDYPLRKFLKCSSCGVSVRGSASTGMMGTKYPKYHCSKCPRSSIRPEELHEQFLAHLANLSPNKSTLRLIKELAVRVWNDEDKLLRQQRKQMNSQRDSIDDQRSKLLAKFVNDEVTKEEKLLLDETLIKSRSEVENRLEKIQRTIGVTQDNIDFALSYMNNAPRLWTAASPEMKITFQYSIFPEGLSYDFGTNRFGTAKLSPLYTLANIKKDPSTSDESLLVTSRRIELRLPG